MDVRFWGTRGSIAKPGRHTLRYGGNTSCVELRSPGGTRVVLDCGTGAHDLGRALCAGDAGPRRGHVLISHTHWDHIQGLPFFAPFFAPGDEWDVHGPRGLGGSVLDALAGQMQYTYFPISLEHFAAEIRYHDLVEGTFELGDVRVEALYLNHPALTLGYRLEADGVVVVYATDHEPHARQRALSEGHARGPEEEQYLRFLEGADLVIHDAQYTAAEYARHVGWGHSPVEFAVDLAATAGARRLALFHHDPERSDDELDAIVVRARERAERAGGHLEVSAATEGARVELEAQRAPRRAASRPDAPARQPTPGPEATHRAVLLAVDDPASAKRLAEAVRSDGLQLLRAGSAEEVLRATAAQQPGVVVLERGLAGGDALALCDALRAQERAAGREPPVVVALALGEEDCDPEAGARAGITDWLVAPFKTTYARTRVRCWLLRTACRWQQAPLPSEEAKRLRALQELGILDSAPEERFDRHTRIAAALADAPIALVSLVDADRQWFKSRHGLDVSETPREMALCAHAILRDAPLLVPDARDDPRFADNPLVTGPPHLRFYAGFPLRVGNGSRVGTLCVIDRRRRALHAATLERLGDVARLVERELERPPESPGAH